ncbi:MAG: EI24 domain-containing protein [Planctomycetota bacterium]
MEPSRCATCGYPSDAPRCPACAGRLRDWEGGEAITIRHRIWPLELFAGFVALPRCTLRLFTDRVFVGQLAAPITASTFASAVIGPLALLGLWVARLWLGREVDPLVYDPRAQLVVLVLCWQVGTPLLLTIAAPFLWKLGTATERAHGVSPTAVPGGDRIGALLGSLRRGARLPATVLLLLPLTTGLAVLRPTAPLAAAVTASLAAIAWFELPSLRRGLTLREHLALLRHNWARAFGFGIAFQVWSLLPVFDILLLLPAATVAAHAQYLRFDRSPRLASDGGGATVDAP